MLLNMTLSIAVGDLHQRHQRKPNLNRTRTVV